MNKMNILIGELCESGNHKKVGALKVKVEAGREKKKKKKMCKHSIERFCSCNRLRKILCCNVLVELFSQQPRLQVPVAAAETNFLSKRTTKHFFCNSLSESYQTHNINHNSHPIERKIEHSLVLWNVWMKNEKKNKDFLFHFIEPCPTTLCDILLDLLSLPVCASCH